ncbi:type I 3-dehydroquinate dehydratase [Nigerium massiliense]|uniref:type I 3-dehydroquinate dehydratase n=1 Tax=Nigerium massiliense TaxID=1522317 RepID=UPI0005905356|nr:type I 3-dehydroquinate dehydratase [Nigerium massiliense]
MATVAFGSVTLGEGRTKVIVPITGESADELVEQASALAGRDDVDIVEWRADYLPDAPDPEDVLAAARRLRGVLGDVPVLFTFRTAAEGGLQSIEPDAYASLNIALVESGLVDAVDVELLFDQAAGDAVIAAARKVGVPVVGSFHRFDGTPPVHELVGHLETMAERGCAVSKAAVMPADAGDVLTLLQATWEMRKALSNQVVLTMAMSGVGVVSRLAGEVFGSCATFGMVGRPSAPGQVPVEKLVPVLDLVHDNL